MVGDGRAGQVERARSGRTRTPRRPRGRRSATAAATAPGSPIALNTRASSAACPASSGSRTSGAAAPRRGPPTRQALLRHTSILTDVETQAQRSVSHSNKQSKQAGGGGRHVACAVGPAGLGPGRHPSRSTGRCSAWSRPSGAPGTPTSPIAEPPLKLVLLEGEADQPTVHRPPRGRGRRPPRRSRAATDSPVRRRPGHGRGERHHLLLRPAGQGLGARTRPRAVGGLHRQGRRPRRHERPTGRRHREMRVRNPGHDRRRDAPRLLLRAVRGPAGVSGERGPGDVLRDGDGAHDASSRRRTDDPWSTRPRR